MSGVEFNATVGFDVLLPEGEQDAVLGRLGAHGAIIAARPGGGSDVVLTFDVPSMRDAADLAVLLVRDATGREPTAVEVVPTTEFDARSGA